MNRIILTLAIFLGGLGSAAGQSVQQLKVAVVRVVSQNRTGTGFVVARDAHSIYIVTASHVVTGDRTPRVEFFSARSRPVTARIGKTEGDDARGLAFLIVATDALDGEEPEPLRLARDVELNGGEEVMTIGFGRGQGDWAVVRATVASLEGRYLKLDRAMQEGNSGGPLLQDSQVVGMIVQDDLESGVATPAETVFQALRGWGVPMAGVAGREAGRVRADPLDKSGEDDSGRGSAVEGALGGIYIGQSFGQALNGQQYVCNAALNLSQTGAIVSGAFENNCGDRGSVVGEVRGTQLIARISSVLSGVCNLAAEIGAMGQSLAGRFECPTLAGTFTLQRR
ncbi:S1 family peptidase [Methylolobus aquaticus]